MLKRATRTGFPAGGQRNTLPARRWKHAEGLHERLKTSAKPLNAMTDPELCPGSGALETVNAGYR